LRVGRVFTIRIRILLFLERLVLFGNCIGTVLVLVVLFLTDSFVALRKLNTVFILNLYVHQKKIVNMTFCCLPTVSLLYVGKQRSLNFISKVLFKVFVLF
jgi:hypothetical protein